MKKKKKSKFDQKTEIFLKKNWGERNREIGERVKGRK